MRAALPILLLALVPLVPTGAADYECMALPLSAVCTGIDPAPDCFGQNSYSDWGFDVFAPRGYAVMVGGKKWCSQDANGTLEGKSMDAGVYSADGQRVATRSERITTTPTGGVTTSSCVTTVQVRLAAVQYATGFACLVEPQHPADFLLP